MEIESFDMASGRLHAIRHGDGGRPTLLLHGVTRRSDDWLGLMPQLAVFGRTIAVDQRGHGRSSRVPGQYRVMDYVQDAIQLMEARFDRPGFLIGHSLGAMVAAGAAAARPGRVAAVVLEDPTFEMTGKRIHETAFASLFQAFRVWAGTSRGVEHVARALSETMIQVPGQGHAVALGTIRDPVSIRYTAACLKQLDPAVLEVALAGRWLEGYDVQETLSRLHCPVLMLQGDWGAGGALPDDYACHIASFCPDLTHVKLAGVGHTIHSTVPDRFLSAVIPFLACSAGL
jgi:pimeloyl-ACP methyl ester carboxylesterase